MKKLGIAAAAALAMGTAFADKVTMNGGSILVGETGAISGNVIKFKSDDLGEIDLKLANIKSIDKARSHTVQFNDGTKSDRVLAVKDGELWQGDAKFDMSNVKSIDPIPEKWHGSVNAAYTAARGNKYENAATITANVNRRWEEDRFIGDFGYYYSESGTSGGNSEKTSDRWLLSAQHDHFWSAKAYHYENARFERDDIQDLDSRFRVGLGGGYQWLENEVFETTGKWSFNQELGVNWIREEYGDGESKNGGFAALRYAHHLGYIPKWYDNVEFFHNFEILPEIDEWEKFLAYSDVGFATKLIMDFDLLVKIEWDYNSQPSGNRKKSDYRYIVGLGYKW